MRAWKMCPLYRPAWTIAGIATLLMLALATPAAADDQQKGWFAALDVALTQPNSLDQHYADQITFPSPGFFPQTNRLVLDTDDDTTFRLGVGYDFGGSLGSLKVSYWEFDNDQTQSGFVAGYTTPAIFGAGYYGSYWNAYYNYVYDGDITATSNVEATTLDVDYVRPMVTGDKSTVNWLIGLRVATYEEDLGYIGNDGGGDYLQDRHLESDAVGFRLGAAGDFTFTENFSLQTGLAVSLLQADTSGISSQTFPAGDFETRIGGDDNIRGTIWDFDVRMLWSTGRFDYYLGYSASLWDDLVTNSVPANSFGLFPADPSPARERNSIGFNSVHGGVIWRFGGGG